MRLLLPGVAALTAAAASLAFALIPGGVRAATDIEVGNFYFCGASFQGGVCETTVNAGDAVTWSVAGGTHTVTECDDAFATCPPSGGFGSGSLGSGGTFSHTFNTAGAFEYRCNIHPSAMRGRITVLAQATPTPALAPTQTASPTATAAASPTPAKPPSTGGPPGDGQGTPRVALVALAALLLLGGSAALVVRRRLA